MTVRLSMSPLFALVLASSMLAAPSVAAATGALDATFGTDGLVVETFGLGFSEARTVVEDDAGGFVVAGWVAPVVSGDGSLTFDPGVARFDRDGVLDTGFGTEGLVTLSLSDDVLRQDELADVAVDAEGRILAAGDVLLRLLPDGTLDTSFGEGGLVLPRVGAKEVSADSLVVTDTGGIVLAGVADPDRVLIAYDENGMVATGFGDDGVATVPGLEDLGVLIRPPALALDAQGRIVASGMAPGFDLRRWSADGVVDTDFGDGGVARGVTDLDGWAYDIAVDGNAVVVAGEGFRDGFGEARGVVARVSDDGTVDTAFGDGGFAAIEAPGISAFEGVTLGPEGRIVAVGDSEVIGQGRDRLAVVWTAQGEPDLSFAPGGVVLEPLSAPASGGWYDVLVDAEGRAITVGNGYTGSSFAFGLAAYDLGSGEPAPEPRFSDVPADNVFADEIAWLAEQGITLGRGDGTFGINDPVTRGAMAAFLYRYAGEPDV